jgi:hypothetical protein
MDAPVTVRQLAQMAARNADVELPERGADAELDPWTTQDPRTLDRWTPAEARDGLRDLADRSHQSAVDASAQARSSTDGEVRIELSNAVFPGTALSLKRTPDGWHLNATADNRQSLDKLNQFTPALVERFARASLGHLRVSLDSAP